jgi:hypothetical protein
MYTNHTNLRKIHTHWRSLFLRTGRRPRSIQCRCTGRCGSGAHPKTFTDSPVQVNDAYVVHNDNICLVHLNKQYITIFVSLSNHKHGSLHIATRHCLIIRQMKCRKCYTDMNVEDD